MGTKKTKQDNLEQVVKTEKFRMQKAFFAIMNDEMAMFILKNFGGRKIFHYFLVCSPLLTPLTP